MKSEDYVFKKIANADKCIGMVDFSYPTQTEESIKESYINHRPNVLNMDEAGNEGGVPHYRYLYLFRTKCNKHFIGYCRGGEWCYKDGVSGDFVLLPEEYEVDKWLEIN